MSTSLTFNVADEAAKTRLDVWLVACLEGKIEGGCSRAGLQRLVRENRVFRQVFGQDGEGWVLEANPARKVRVGEVYRVDIPEPTDSVLVAEDIPLTVLFEDEHLLVLNKPAGLTVHPAPGNETGTLVQALLHHCGVSLSGLNGERRPGIVHRLDKDTSGVMVVAKHDVAHRGLAKQFAKHDIHRRYFAIVRGVPLPASGRIEGEIGRHPTQRLKRAVLGQNGVGKGKAAVTHYRTLESFGKTASLVACMLETGRTHQIRVHLSHKGHPILGDWLYGSNNPLPGWPKDVSPLAPERQMLHAAELGFVHPISGENLEFAVPLPPDMETVMGQLRANC